MDTNEAAMSLGRKKLNELELEVIRTTLYQLVPIIKRLTADGMIYTKIEVPAGEVPPPGGA